MMSPGREVGIALVQALGSRARRGDDAVSEARRESLDLRDDPVGGVAVEALGDVRVGIDRIDTARTATGVGDILLTEQHEGP